MHAWLNDVANPKITNKRHKDFMEKVTADVVQILKELESNEITGVPNA